MPTDPEVRSLLTCALLTLDPRITDKRAAVHSALVEASLFRVGKPATSDEIRDEVDHLVEQRGFFRDEDLSKAINDCLKRGTLRPRDARFELAEPASRSFRDLAADNEAAFRRVRSAMIQEIELETAQALPPEVGDALFQGIRSFLAQRVYESSIQLARDTVPLDEIVLQFDDEDPLQPLDALLDECLPPDRKLLRAQAKSALTEYFRSMPDDLARVLLLIHHSVLISQILCLDPAIVALHRKWFARRRLYLDTNLVIALICESHKLHRVVKEVVAASLHLGAQLFVSPITRQELGNQVERAKADHRRIDRDPLVKRLANQGDDAILAAFLALQKSQPSIQWEPFIAQFERLEELLLEYNILVEEDGFAQAQGHPFLERIRKAVKDAKPFFASDNVIEHDALNCALVLQLRSLHRPDERGQVVWLLTIDRSLRKAQRILWGSKDIPAPYCMQAADWGEIVLPAQNLLDFVFGDFIGYLAQTRLGAIADPQVIQLDFLETIHDAEIDVDRLLRLHPDQVRATIAVLQSSREARIFAANAARAPEPSERRESQTQLQLLLDQAIEDTDPVKATRADYDRKLALLTHHLTLKEAAIASLQDRLLSIESNWGFRLASWLARIIRR